MIWIRTCTLSTFLGHAGRTVYRNRIFVIIPEENENENYKTSAKHSYLNAIKGIKNPWTPSWTELSVLLSLLTKYLDKINVLFVGKDKIKNEKLLTTMGNRRPL